MTTTKEITAFLEAVYGHGDGWVHLTGLHKQVSAAKCGDVEALAGLIKNQTDLYLSAAVIGTETGSGTGNRIEDKDAHQLTSLWVDLDRADEPGHKTKAKLWTRDDIAQLWEWLPIQPTAVVDSGGGWWFHFVLTEPQPLNQDGTGELLLARWAQWWQHISNRFDRQVDSVFNPARIARAPGSINGKADQPRPTQIKSLNADRQFSADQLDEILPAPEAPRTVTPKGPGDTTRPGDTYNQAATVDQMVALLEGHGFHSPQQKAGRVDLTRPGKQRREGHSATVWPDATITFWSSSPEGQPGAVTLRDRTGASGTYDPFGAYVAIEHLGNFETATRELSPNGHHPKPAPNNPAVNLEDCQIPDEVWEARPELAHIRQAAWSRGRSPDAVLAGSLTRIVADTPHTVRLPAIVGAPCGLTLLAGIAGPPGSGKSTAATIATALVPATILNADCDGVPPGSGEGFIELLFDWVKEPDPDTGKQIRIHRQTKHNAYMYVDEGEVLAKLAGRQSGSTLLPALRTAFTSGTLGQANASQERKRIIPAGQAVYGVVLGIQPELAGPLFDEAGAGTPQRILWASTTVPTPEPGNRPEWPGPLERHQPGPDDWRDHQRGGSYTRHELGIPAHIADEIAHRDHKRQQHGAEHLDEHQDLIQLKVAAALALLQGRLDLTDDDWRLAAHITDTSRQVRNRLADHLQSMAAEREATTADRLARRQVRVAEKTTEWRIVETARNLTKKVRKDPGEYTRGKLRAALSANQREVFDEAYDHALEQQWIAERDEPGQGTSKQRVHPGSETL